MMQALPIEWVERIFLRLHGRFGNSFFDKYRVGQNNVDGDDVGLENAKLVWSQELAGMTGERIAEALKASYEFAPSCDDFKAKCVTNIQVQEYVALPKKINREAGKEYASNVVDYVAQQIKPTRDYKKWAKDILADESKSTMWAIKCAKQALGRSDY